MKTHLQRFDVSTEIYWPRQVFFRSDITNYEEFRISDRIHDKITDSIKVYSLVFAIFIGEQLSAWLRRGKCMLKTSCFEIMSNFQTLLQLHGENGGDFTRMKWKFIIVFMSTAIEFVQKTCRVTKQLDIPCSWKLICCITANYMNPEISRVCSIHWITHSFQRESVDSEFLPVDYGK